MIFLWIGPVGGYGFLEAQKSKASDFMEQMGLREADYTAVAAHDLVGPDLVFFLPLFLQFFIFFYM